MPDDKELPNPTGRTMTAVLHRTGDEPIGAAREAAACFLHEAQQEHGVALYEETEPVVRLVVSELITNAYTHAPGQCRLDLEIRDDTIEVSVWDHHSHLPTPLATDPARVGGHGLEIVRALSKALTIKPDNGGKRISASIALAAPPAAMAS
ncbi:ATP-binding protein [Streptomyces sp. NPDC091272]|uniref:ATP-binding protein n=1 Tax=Streptomyces sp. NPDC091272 TaxID=3365981 RepID=UPI00380EA19D